MFIAPAQAGDTVTGTAEVRDAATVAIAGGRFRLEGIVPPEDDANSDAAKRTLTAFVATQPVTCAKIRRLGHGYFLASCKRDSGEDLALHLLGEGLARTDADASGGALEAQEAAKRAHKGLWRGG